MQPIAGETPPELGEAPVMTVWPTIASLPLGRWIGRYAATKWGWGPFTVGALFALLTIPISLVLYCWLFAPAVCRRYALTTRRVIIRRGLGALEDRWISMEDFDEIVVEVLPGQQWFHAGDLSFRRGGEELLRLAGVRRPETVRRACLKVQKALLAVGKTVGRQLAAAAAEIAD